MKFSRFSFEALATNFPYLLPSGIFVFHRPSSASQILYFSVCCKRIFSRLISSNSFSTSFLLIIALSVASSNSSFVHLTPSILHSFEFINDLLFGSQTLAVCNSGKRLEVMNSRACSCYGLIVACSIIDFWRSKIENSTLHKKAE